MYQEETEIIERMNTNKKLESEVAELIKDDTQQTQLREHLISLIFSKFREERDTATEILTKKMIKQFQMYTVRHDELPETWIYNKGIYIPQGKTFIKESCRKILGIAYSPQIANKVIGKVETDTYIEADDFFKSNVVEEIVCLNGLLDLKEKKLKPFSSERIHFTKIPVTYNPEAKCPKIDNFLHGVLETYEDVLAMYELFGYCLWKDAFLEQAVMLLGDGRNGKGKTLELLKRLLGEENTKGIPLQKLEEDNFSECELFGKLANLAGDISDQPLNHTGKFKGITGRDTLSASRKFKTKIDFVNYSKQIFATNKLPKTMDTSDAFWERWLYFRFPFTFKSQEDIDLMKKEGKDTSKIKLKNPEIINEISSQEELSGLLNKSLEGLHRLFEQKKFTTSKTADEIKMFWIQKSDSFLAFCMECIEDCSESYITKEDLRKRYQKYCKENKAIAESSEKWLKETLATKYGCVEDYRTVPVFNKDGEVDKDAFGREIKDRKAIWQGIKFKEVKECPASVQSTAQTSETNCSNNSEENAKNVTKQKN